MSSTLNDPNQQNQLAQLRRLFEQGLLSEANYRAALRGMGLDPATVFDQQRQQISGGQYNAGRDITIVQQVERPEAMPASLRRAYLSRLLQQTRRLPLAGIDPRAAGDEGSQELQLAAVYTALLTQQPEVEAEAFEQKVRERPEGETRYRSALELLNREPYLVLLGEPGGGKSTFVNFVGLCLAGEGLGEAEANLALLTTPLPVEGREEKPRPQAWDHGPLLPVRIVLRDLAARGLPTPGRPATGDTLWTFIVAELGETLQEYAPHLKKALQEAGGLILLDGLDEVPDAGRRREQVKAAVQGFAADFPRCRFLVTSRTYAYQRQDWKLERFAEAVLSPFAPGQVARFIEHWYTHVGGVRHLNPEDAQGRAALLRSAIERNPRLAELAARPLLLTLMASLHAWRGGSLPEKREALYADAVDLLLDQWESPKVVRDAAGQPLVHQPSLAEWLKVERAVVRAELERLAFQAHRNQPRLTGTADIRQGQLVESLLRVAHNPEVNPARLVEYLRDRAGLLAARGEGIYAFPHRTFQEYLAACHLTDEGFPDILADLLRADPQRWREATLLAGAKAARGTASAAWSLAEALCYREPPGQALKAMPEADCWGALLAAQALLENERERLERVSERNAPKLARIRGWLQSIIHHGWLPPVDRALAGEALAVLGDDRDFETLIPVPAGPFLMGDNRDKDASPQHEVNLPAFKIGQYPVTNGQYRRFVEATGRKWLRPELQPERQTHPVINITWYDACAYCDWLTGVWRNEGRIAAHETVRLPSEAEWEKAARGPDGRAYPWGQDWAEDRANTSEVGLGDTCPVGLFPQGASPYSCLDMAGNVWEWTISLWGEKPFEPAFKYPYNPADGRENLEAGDKLLRVLRGGSFYDDQGYARCAFRLWYFPNDRYFYLGFRVVVVSPVSASAL